MSPKRLQQMALAFTVQQTDNSTLLATVVQAAPNTGRERDGVGALYYVVAVFMIYGLSILMMIASYTRKNREDHRLNRYLKDMAIVRKKAQLQVINAAAKLASSEKGLQRIPSEPEFSTEADHCRFGLDDPHVRGRATCALSGDARVSTSAGFSWESTALPFVDALESVHLLNETRECSTNRSLADNGFNMQHHGCAVEMSAMTSSVTDGLPETVVCMENDGRLVCVTTDSVIPDNITPCNISNSSSNNSSNSNNSSSRNLSDSNGSGSNGSGSSGSDNNGSDNNDFDSNCFESNGSKSNGSNSNGCDNCACESIGLTMAFRSREDNDGVGREECVLQMDELRQADSVA